VFTSLIVGHRPDLETDLFWINSRRSAFGRLSGESEHAFHRLRDVTKRALFDRQQRERCMSLVEPMGKNVVDQIVGTMVAIPVSLPDQ